LELFVMLSNCYTFYVALVLYLIVVKRKEARLVTFSSSVAKDGDGLPPLPYVA